MNRDASAAEKQDVLNGEFEARRPYAANSSGNGSDENSGGPGKPEDMSYSHYPPPETMALKRQLKARHVAMISIGGVIGTGLFVGTANSLQSGGPVGLWLGYIVVGSITFAVMVSLGEMISWFPIPGGHIALAERFVDPAFSFAMGWNYWYNWAITLPAELSASAVLVSFWDKNTNSAVYISVCFVVVVTINMCGAAVYGECEFWFASIKVITITGLIILGIIIDAGGGPNGDRIGFRYWVSPGPFVSPGACFNFGS